MNCGYTLQLLQCRTIIHGEASFLENLSFKTNASSEEEVFILRLLNVTKRDNHLSHFWCKHDNLATSTNRYLGIARLVVWTKPTEQPQCRYNFESETPIVISRQESYAIFLSCSLEGGDPQPLLRWFKTSENGLMQIGGSSTNSLNTSVLVTASDHGREYICQAAIDATPDEPLTCKIIPYNPMPEIVVTSEKQIYQIRERISVFCNNTGVSTADTSYLWYINDILVSASSHDGITITNTMKSSTIFISNYPFSSDTIEVTCEGVIPNVATANATLNLHVGLTVTHSTEVMHISDQANSKLITIIAAAAGGSFVTTIVAITVFCVYLKCKKSVKEADKDQVETISMEVNATSQPGRSHETHNPDHNPTLNTYYEEVNKDRIPARAYQELSTDNKDAKRHVYQTHIVDMNAEGLTFNPEVESPAGPNDDYEVPVNI